MITNYGISRIANPWVWSLAWGLLWLCLRSASAQEGLVINEIMYDPVGDGSEYVEIFNRSDQPQALSGLRLADSRGMPVPLPDETPPVLAAGAWLVLVRGGEAFARQFPAVSFIEVPGWPALNNGGDQVVLSTVAGRVDSVAYSPGWGGQDVALERIDPWRFSNDPANWASTTIPAGGTPGAVNSTFHPDQQPPRLTFVEERAPSALRAYFDEPVDAGRLVPAQFVVNETHIPIQVVAEADGRSVTLTLAAGVAPHTLTVADVTDLAGNLMPVVSVSIARLPEAGTVVVNEIMYDPLADRFDHRPDQPEYIELYNTNPFPVGLHQGYLTRAQDEAGVADTLRWASDPVALEAGAYVIVFAGTSAVLAEAFPGVVEASVAPLYWSITRASAWRKAGDAVRLHRADGALLDEVAYQPAWHHPGVLDAKGVSLERVHAQGASHAPSNWTSSLHPSGGTPGRANSVGLSRREAEDALGLTISPAVFSPDGDGIDEVAGLYYRLEEVPGLLRARVFDAEGRPVRVLTEATPAGHEGVLVWDGRDDGGHLLRVGVYVVWLEVVHTAQARAVVYQRAVVLARPLGG